MLLLVLAAGPLLAGCWSLSEVEDLAFITAAGVDAVGGDRIRLTLQIIEPGAVGVAGGMLGGGGAMLQGKAVWVVSAEGVTILDALRNLARESPRRLTWTHNRIVVLGQGLARKGISRYIDFFSRQRELRLTTWIMVAEGEAKDILNAEPVFERVPATAIARLARGGAGFTIMLRNFYDRMARPGIHPAAPLVQVVTGEEGGMDKVRGQPAREVRLSGAAAFKDDRMVGFFDDAETRGLLWLTGEVKRGVITVPCQREENGNASILIRDASTVIQPARSDGNVSITVQIRVEGDLSEVGGCALDLERPETIKRLEEAMVRDIQARVRAALRKAQEEFRADVFGFGRSVGHRFPSLWAELEDQWDDVFPEVDVEIQARAEIRRVGLHTEPLGERLRR